MAELEPIFEQLGLQQYLSAFLEEGFDTWEVVSCITESDLDTLNVKLGHRRKLQNEIASFRGITFDQLVATRAQALSIKATKYAESEGKSTTRDFEHQCKQDESQIPVSTASTKRKYRRHPKPDETAPERPPSAYVLFSNKIREEIRHQNMSFTEIAKTVGEKWQVLKPEEKEAFEKEATAKKIYYTTLMAKYKQTENYEEYNRYLADFTAKNAPPQTGKRPKLETELSTASSASDGSVTGVQSYDRLRRDSSCLIGNSSSTTSHDSPKPAVLQSFAGHSHNSPPQPPFSPPQSLTTLSVHRLSINSQNTPQPDVFSRSALDTVQSQQLPRIRPLDIRDQSTRENGLALVLPEPECSLQETYSPSGLALVQTHSISSINHIPGYSQSPDRLFMGDGAIISTYRSYPSDNVVQNQKHSIIDRWNRHVQSHDTPSRAIRQDPVVTSS